jgi:hypothetical protein
MPTSTSPAGKYCVSLQQNLNLTKNGEKKMLKLPLYHFYFVYLPHRTSACARVRH